MGARGSQRGAVLLEAVVSFGLLVGVVFLHLELVRRAWVEVLCHHGAFLAVRRAVFDSARAGVAAPRRFWARALGKKAARRFGRPTRVFFLRSPRDRVAKVYTHYPAFWSFPWRQGWKRKFEVTRPCRFGYLP